jgi:hypothetical protein
MYHYIDTAYDVTTQLFGPDSGIPWWSWIVVFVALFWKVLIPERKTAREIAEARDSAMLSDIFGGKDGNEAGKKGKKKKSKK